MVRCQVYLEDILIDMRCEKKRDMKDCLRVFGLGNWEYKFLLIKVSENVGYVYFRKKLGV